LGTAARAVDWQTAMQVNDPIVAFYAGDSPDAVGRSLAEILAWDDERLEQVHDFIQWLFPLSQASGVNPLAPLVTRTTVEAFAGDPVLRGRLLASFDRMLRFYGLERYTGDNGLAVRPAATYDARKHAWQTPGNHNHLRITRILTSLGLLGLGQEAEAFGACLARLFEREGTSAISERSFQFWMNAVGR
jgi:hypothetical protein